MEEVNELGFTASQLHVFKRQIESLQKINVNFHALMTGGRVFTHEFNRILGKSRVRQQKRQKGAESESEIDEDKANASESEEPELDNTTDSDTEESADLDSAILSDSDAENEIKISSPISKSEKTRRSSRAESTKKKVIKDYSSNDDSSDLDSDDDDDATIETKNTSDNNNNNNNTTATTGTPKEKNTIKSPSKSPAKKRKFVIDVTSPVNGTTPIPAHLEKLTPVIVPWPRDDDAVCTVCGDPDSMDDNAILYCEGQGCTVTVHQRCYGVDSVPQGEWLCDACKLHLSPTDALCALCPVVGGAVRKVVSMGKTVPVQKGKHACVHLACCLWTPEVILKEPEKMSDVDLSALTAQRVGLRCHLCLQGGGSAIQCNYGSCCKAFHVLCGRFAQHEITFKIDGCPLSFCDVHSRPSFKYVREAMQMGKEFEEVIGVGIGGESGENEEDTAVEPADLVAYELKRLENVKRIEKARKAIFN